MKLLALICDMDGVLVDSSRVHAAAWQALFADRGVGFDYEDYQRVAAGRSRREVLRTVLGRVADEDALMARKAGLVREAMNRGALRPMDGAERLVERARAAGLRVGVGSSSRMAKEFLHHTGLFHRFDVVVDRNDVERGKPAPDVFQEAARRLSVSARAALVIEDTLAGVRAARAAGCRVVALDSGADASLRSAGVEVVAHLDHVDLSASLG